MDDLPDDESTQLQSDTLDLETVQAAETSDLFGTAAEYSSTYDSDCESLRRNIIPPIDMVAFAPSDSIGSSRPAGIMGSISFIEPVSPRVDDGNLGYFPTPHSSINLNGLLSWYSMSPTLDAPTALSRRIFPHSHLLARFEDLERLTRFQLYQAHASGLHQLKRISPEDAFQLLEEERKIQFVKDSPDDGFEKNVNEGGIIPHGDMFTREDHAKGFLRCLPYCIAKFISNMVFFNFIILGMIFFLSTIIIEFGGAQLIISWYVRTLIKGLTGVPNQLLIVLFSNQLMLLGSRGFELMEDIMSTRLLHWFFRSYSNFRSVLLRVLLLLIIIPILIIIIYDFLSILISADVVPTSLIIASFCCMTFILVRHILYPFGIGASHSHFVDHQPRAPSYMVITADRSVVEIKSRKIIALLILVPAVISLIMGIVMAVFFTRTTMCIFFAFSLLTSVFAMRFLTGGAEGLSTVIIFVIWLAVTCWTTIMSFLAYGDMKKNWTAVLTIAMLLSYFILLGVICLMTRSRHKFNHFFVLFSQGCMVLAFTVAIVFLFIQDWVLGLLGLVALIHSTASYIGYSNINIWSAALFSIALGLSSIGAILVSSDPKLFENKNGVLISSSSSATDVPYGVCFNRFGSSSLNNTSTDSYSGFSILTLGLATVLSRNTNIDGLHKDLHKLGSTLNDITDQISAKTSNTFLGYRFRVYNDSATGLALIVAVPMSNNLIDRLNGYLPWVLTASKELWITQKFSATLFLGVATLAGMRIPIQDAMDDAIDFVTEVLNRNHTKGSVVLTGESVAGSFLASVGARMDMSSATFGSAPLTSVFRIFGLDSKDGLFDALILRPNPIQKVPKDTAQFETTVWLRCKANNCKFSAGQVCELVEVCGSSLTHKGC